MKPEPSKWAIATIIVFGIAGSLTVGVVLVTLSRPFTPFEASFLQILILAISLFGSYAFAKRSAGAAAQELFRPHARSAFRRVLRIYANLSRLAIIIEDRRQQTSISNAKDLDLIHAVIEQQIPTIGDAIEDWRDIVPEDVKDIEKRLEQHPGEAEDLRR